MQTNERYYQESGVIGVQGILFLFLAGILTAGILGAVYAYAVFYIPFIYLNVILTVLFGLAIGWVMAQVGYRAKIRNQQAIWIAGGAFGFAGVYFAWVFWLHAFSGQELLTFDITMILGFMKLIAATGAWEVFGWMPTGGALYAVWGIEALLIIGAAVFFAIGHTARVPFCEDCNEWAVPEVLTMTLAPINNRPQMVEALERGDFSELTKLRNTTADHSLRTKVVVLKCPGSGKANFLTLVALRLSVNDDGELELKEELIVENLKLTSSELYDIQKWSKKLDEAPVVEE